LRHHLLKGLSDAEIAALYWHWGFWARPDQLPPERHWTTWMMLGGRGAGKTRAGAEWVRARVEAPQAAQKARRIALIGETYGSARAFMVEGPSGILAVSPPDWRPQFMPSRNLLIWPNGAEATLFSAERPDALRGPQFDAAWCDELAKWRHDEETWDMLQFGLRLGQNPQQVVTTTPRPGWRLWDEAGQELLVFNGTDWQSVAPQDDATSLITTQEAAVDITESSLITLPSHTIFFGVAIKVLDKIEGAQAWQLGVTGASNRFGNWLSLEAGSEIRGPTNPSVYWQNTPIVATPLNGEFTAGRVAVAIYYLQLPIPSAT
jgi:hypothetical protein